MARRWERTETGRCSEFDRTEPDMGPRTPGQDRSHAETVPRSRSRPASAQGTVSGMAM